MLDTTHSIKLSKQSECATWTLYCIYTPRYLLTPPCHFTCPYHYVALMLSLPSHRICLWMRSARLGAWLNTYTHIIMAGIETLWFLEYLSGTVVYFGSFFKRFTNHKDGKDWKKGSRHKANRLWKATWGRGKQDLTCSSQWLIFIRANIETSIRFWAWITHKLCLGEETRQLESLMIHHVTQ